MSEHETLQERLDRAVRSYCNHEDKQENRMPDGDCARCAEIAGACYEAVRAKLAALRELMACGHPRACWQESYAALLPDESPDFKGLTVDGHCRACTVPRRYCSFSRMYGRALRTKARPGRIEGRD